MGPVGRVSGARVRGQCRHALLAGGGFEGFVPSPPVQVAGPPRVPLAACPRRFIPLVASWLPTLRGRRQTSWTHRLWPDGGL